MAGVSVVGDGNQIVLDFSSLGEALQLWKPWSDGQRRTEITELLHRALSSAGLSLEVRVQGKPVAQLGGSHMSGIALRLLAQGAVH